MPDKINLMDKFALFKERWSPKIVGQVNDTHIKIARLEGEFQWHRHEKEDEMFLIIRGVLRIEFRDRDVTLSEGEMVVVPHGVEHRPVAEKEAMVMLIEPSGTVNTGDRESERTVTPEWI